MGKVEDVSPVVWLNSLTELPHPHSIGLVVCKVMKLILTSARKISLNIGIHLYFTRGKLTLEF